MYIHNFPSYQIVYGYSRLTILNFKTPHIRQTDIIPETHQSTPGISKKDISAQFTSMFDASHN